MSNYNRTRDVEQLLHKTHGKPPSFSIHLHTDHWILNNGPKFLYHNQIAALLDDIRAHRIPVDFLEHFDTARVPFYDGCMVVELLDYRSTDTVPDNPECTRVILHPTSETLYADICSLNQVQGGTWSDHDALQVEAKLLLATSPPLCLDPDPHLTRIANHVLRVSTPTVPASLKRKAATLETEEGETDKARRAKIMAFMTPRNGRLHAPNYRLLDIIQKFKNSSSDKLAASTNGVHSYISASVPGRISSSPANDARSIPIPDTAQGAFMTPALARGKDSHTPASLSAAHPFVLQYAGQPSRASPAPGAPMQPQVYASVQAATDAAKRAATPSQHQQLLYQQRLQVQQRSMQQQAVQKQAIPSPKVPPPQIQHQQQQQQQRQYAPSPKSNVPSPAKNATAAPTSTPTFQPTIPDVRFLQQPPVRRNSTSAQHPSSQQAAATTTGQRLMRQQQAALIAAQQQRRNVSLGAATGVAAGIASSSGGRSTPLVPSPARTSPGVGHVSHLAQQPQVQAQSQTPVQHGHAYAHPYPGAGLPHQMNTTATGSVRASNDGAQTHPPTLPYAQVFGYPMQGQMAQGYWQVPMHGTPQVAGQQQRAGQGQGR